VAVAIIAMTLATVVGAQCFSSPVLGAAGAAAVLAIGVAAFGWTGPVAAVACAVVALLAARALYEHAHPAGRPERRPLGELQAVAPVDWDRFMRDLEQWSTARVRRTRP